MDPIISSIVTALAAGAAAALKPTGESLIKDAYEGIKNIIVTKYKNVNLQPLESKPESKIKQSSLAEDLSETNVANDSEILALSQHLLDLVSKYDTQSLTALGVDIEEVKAASLKIGTIISTGTGVKIKKGEFKGDITINDVRAGGGNHVNP
ncbi:hypothetical protein [Xanthocytophaga agilis]|uniref:Uncharacterized protein n=1 Tax=Xanthocytophaga agilis TaxID=3048010 RepID=A0AAE3RBW6_9BACT|nr:hypothetical protein [Xanthocytophaga agilis]MDJ1505512.1 hypothetical protein [Xanthocytophaga agilis]